MFFEGIDNDHGCTAGWAGVGVDQWVVVSNVCFWCKRIVTAIAEEFTQSLHILDSGMVGKESVVADAVEACGQHVNEKASDELGRGQGHGLVTMMPLGTIVLPLKGDTTFITGDQTTVGNRDPMRVARQVLESVMGLSPVLWVEVW